VYSVGSGGCSFYHGVYIGTSGSIENNIIYGNSSAGIISWHNATNLNIFNNTIFGNNQGIIVGSGVYFGNFSGPNDYTNVANNIVVDNAQMGIDEEGSVGTHNLYSANLSFGNGPTGNSNWNLLRSSHTA